MNISDTRISEIEKIREEDIDYSEITELNEEWFKSAKIVCPERKKSISIRLDLGVLEWFKSQGKGYQSRINAILKAYVKAQESRVSS